MHIQNFTLYSLFFLLLPVISCHEDAKNIGIPDHPHQMRNQRSSTEEKTAEKWQKLLNILGFASIDTPAPVGPNAYELSRQQLQKHLSTPSTLLTNMEQTATYESYLNQAIDKFVADPKEYQCQSVISFEKLQNAEKIDDQGTTVPLVDDNGHEAAEVYILHYRLGIDSPKKQRSALMVLPTSNANDSAILAYAHGGDKGLNYHEIVKVIGKRQKDHIIIAPTFPGEPLCKNKGLNGSKTQHFCHQHGTLIEATGKSIPWENDVTDLIGVHGCLVNTIRSPQFSAPDDLRQKLTKKHLPLKLSPLLTHYLQGQNIPASLVMGTSRGGLVAGLALAHSGAHLKKLVDQFASQPEKLENIFTELNTMTGKFSCAAHVSGPSSILMGRFRIVLESLIKGQIQHTRFNRLPGVPQLDKKFAKIREEDSEEVIQEIAQEIFRRDLGFLSPLVLAGIRDWSRLDAHFDELLFPSGSIAFFHGIDDKIVPFEQSAFAYKVYDRASSLPIVLEKTNSKAFHRGQGDDIYRGLNLFIRAFHPQEQLKANEDQHIDQAYAESYSFIPADFYPQEKANKTFRHFADKARDHAQAEFEGRTTTGHSQATNLLLKLSEENFARAEDRDCQLNDLVNVLQFPDETLSDQEKRSLSRAYIFAGRLKDLEEQTRIDTDKKIIDPGLLKPEQVFELWRSQHCSL